MTLFERWRCLVQSIATFVVSPVVRTLTAVTVVFALCTAPAVQASPLIELSAAQMQTLLNNVRQAAEKQTYQGLIVYQEAGAMQSLRIAHRFDGQNQQERLVELDDVAREYIRFNQVVQCFIPDQKLILIEPAQNRRFPALTLGDMHAVQQNYSVWQDPKPRRVAGRVCQRYEVKPKDQLRRGFSVCVDDQSQLMLKVQTLDIKGRVIEQVAFSEVTIGGVIDDQVFEPSWSTQGWQVVEHIQQPTDLKAKGWHIKPVAGFYKQAQLKRMLNVDQWVEQVVLSDGFVQASIFIEPSDPTQIQQLSRRAFELGSVNMQSKQINDYRVTVLGEMPQATLAQIISAIHYQPNVSHSQLKR